MDELPRYRDIADRFAAAIRNQSYRPGTFLPSEAEICAAHACSRTTARAALLSLARQGIVQSVPKRGWRVATAMSVAATPAQELDRGGVLLVTTGAGARHLLAPLQQALQQKGIAVGLALVDAAESSAGLQQAVIEALARATAGLACVCVPDRLSTATLAALAAWRGRMLVVGPAAPDDEIDAVSVADGVGMRRLVERLHAQGHRAIAFCQVQNEARSVRLVLRQQGYEKAMQRLGLQPQVVGMESGMWHLMSGYVDRVWDRFGMADPARRPTAIIGCSGAALAPVACALADKGIVFPRDVSLAAWGDFEDPGVAEVIQVDDLLRAEDPWADLATIAGERLERLRAGGQGPCQLVTVHPAILGGGTVAQRS